MNELLWFGIGAVTMLVTIIVLLSRKNKKNITPEQYYNQLKYNKLKETFPEWYNEQTF